VASGTEDAIAVGGLGLALWAPVAAGVLLVAATGVGIALVWWALRALGKSQQNKARSASQV
jgi:hypothetical protein